jgi:hypothetical protein
MRLTKQETSPRIIIPRILSQPMVPPPPPYETSHPSNGEITYPTQLSGAIYRNRMWLYPTQWQPWNWKNQKADQQSATQLPAQQRLEESSFKFHQHYNFCETAKSRKQKCVWTTIGRAKRLVGWESTMRMMPDPRCFYLIYSCIE